METTTKVKVFTQISRDFWILNRARKYILEGVRYGEAKMKAEKVFNEEVMNGFFEMEN